MFARLYAKLSKDTTIKMICLIVLSIIAAIILIITGGIINYVIAGGLIICCALIIDDFFEFVKLIEHAYDNSTTTDKVIDCLVSMHEALYEDEENDDEK